MLLHMAPATSTKTPPPTTRTERRKARTASAILDAAERLFLSRGFGVTTMDEISEAADVAVGSIYAHFASKDGVYAALIDRALELDKRYCDEGFVAGTTPVEQLVGLAEGYLRFAREHPGYFRLFRFPPPDRPGPDAAPQPAERVAQRIREETARMVDLVRKAVDQGIARPVDPKSTATFLWAAWDGVIACHLGPANMNLTDSEFEEVLNRAREVITLGLLAPAAPDSEGKAR
jgi:AcrR family transcriptional regulator